MHPRSIISLVIQPTALVFEQNSFFVLAFNACIAALIDAAIPLRLLPAAVFSGQGMRAVFDYSALSSSTEGSGPHLCPISLHTDRALTADQIERLLSEAYENGRIQITQLHESINIKYKFETA